MLIISVLMDCFRSIRIEYKIISSSEKEFLSVDHPVDSNSELYIHTDHDEIKILML